jgi:hypothetical protein
VIRDGQAQDDVPEEREALVGLGAVVNPRGMREGLPRQVVGQFVE